MPKLIDALSKHPAVAMAAAVGSPDAYAGEVPVAYVQPKPGMAVSDQEVIDPPRPTFSSGSDPQAREDHAVAAGDQDRQDLQSRPFSRNARSRPLFAVRRKT